MMHFSLHVFVYLDTYLFLIPSPSSMRLRNGHCHYVAEKWALL